MKALTQEDRLFPKRLKTPKARPNRVFAAIRSLPDRALFWAGSLLLLSGVLEVESLPE